MLASFPTSQLMVGSIIPGVRQQLASIRLATYPDHSDEALLMKRKRVQNPLVSFPGMNQDHSQGHAFLEKLKTLMAGGGAQHSSFHGVDQPKMMKGYQPIRENRDWRNM